MIFAFPSRRRWLSILLTLTLLLLCQLTLTNCNLAEFKIAAAQFSQWVTSNIGDPKTFNYAFNQ